MGWEMNENKVPTSLGVRKSEAGREESSVTNSEEPEEMLMIWETESCRELFVSAFCSTWRHERSTTPFPNDGTDPAVEGENENLD